MNANCQTNGSNEVTDPETNAENRPIEGRRKQRRAIPAPLALLNWCAYAEAARSRGDEPEEFITWMSRTRGRA